jgi:hypothetical protein
VSFKFLGENLKFELVTGFGKMVEMNLTDEGIDKTKVASVFKFLKKSDLESFELPLKDKYYKTPTVFN